MSWPIPLFGAAEPPQLQSTVLQEREAQTDAISELAMAYEARANATGDARQGALALLERLRDEVGPRFTGPKPSKRSVAGRRVRDMERAIDRILQDGKAA